MTKLKLIYTINNVGEWILVGDYGLGIFGKDWYICCFPENPCEKHKTEYQKI